MGDSLKRTEKQDKILLRCSLPVFLNIPMMHYPSIIRSVTHPSSSSAFFLDGLVGLFFPEIKFSIVAGMGMSEREVRVASSPTLLLETRACLSFKTSGSSLRVRTRTSALSDLGRVAYMPFSLDPSSPWSSSLRSQM